MKQDSAGQIPGQFEMQIYYKSLELELMQDPARMGMGISQRLPGHLLGQAKKEKRKKALLVHYFPG
jgi:hypothetical protein